MKVKLEYHEALIAAEVGMRRQLAALGRPDAHGFDGENGWTVHIEGAGGEMAFAKSADLYWNGSVNTYKVGGDVGLIQVRTRSKHDYDLIVRHDDRDEDIFVLVTGKMPNYQIRGWIQGGEAKQDEWVKTHGGRPAAWFVPAAKLKGIETMPRMYG